MKAIIWQRFAICLKAFSYECQGRLMFLDFRKNLEKIEVFAMKSFLIIMVLMFIL